MPYSGDRYVRYESKESNPRNPTYIWDGPTPSYARHVLSLPPDQAFSIIDTFARHRHIPYQDANRFFTQAERLLSPYNLSRHRAHYYNFF